MIDFSIPPDVERLRQQVSDFVRDVCIPAEAQLSGGGLDDALRSELQDHARAAGVFAPHLPAALGGRGLDLRGWSVVFEAAGYSPLGPQALNCAAPDEGNMHLLEQIASPEQAERYLRPLAAGDTRSAFAMTEPPPGAGSDPSLLQTAARRVDGGWAVDGEKRFITGADGAGFTIVMARTSEQLLGGEGATLFVVEAGNPGMRIERPIHTMDRAFAGGHAELVFEDCRVPDTAVLGEVGQGFALAQLRLAPARLTHCMRWLGLACRALDVALDYAAEREAFGRRLQEHGMVQAMIADSEIDIQASRALIQKGAWTIDGGGRGLEESSVAKAFVAEAVWRVVDRAVQICGGHGVSHDAPLAWFLNEVRPFRVYDGPSEVHRWSIARRATRRRAKEHEHDRPPT